MTPSGLSYRCGVCAENWPWMTAFHVCPVCESECRAIRFYPGHEDAVLSLADANQILRDHGIRVVVRRGRRGKGRRPTAKELRALRGALDAWAHERPSWLR